MYQITMEKRKRAIARRRVAYQIKNSLSYSIIHRIVYYGAIVMAIVAAAALLLGFRRKTKHISIAVAFLPAIATIYA